MKCPSSFEQPPPDPGAPATARPERYALNVALVYRDAATRKWARQLCRRVEKLVGAEGVRSTWWNLCDLGEPGVLAGAVSMAIRADVIVVALHADQPLPLPFYVWVEAWLPHRRPRTGSLLALIDLPAQPSSRADEAREYLQGIARQARLDFLIEERKLVVAAPPALARGSVRQKVEALRAA